MTANRLSYGRGTLTHACPRAESHYMCTHTHTCVRVRSHTHTHHRSHAAVATCPCLRCCRRPARSPSLWSAPLWQPMPRWLLASWSTPPQPMPDRLLLTSQPTLIGFPSPRAALRLVLVTAGSVAPPPAPAPHVPSSTAGRWISSFELDLNRRNPVWNKLRRLIKMDTNWIWFKLN
jgi:hypothetical protein